MKDQLFMLKPGFFDGDKGPFYCRDSIAIEGMLGMFPQLRDAIDIVYVEYARPRLPIIAQIGIENQSAPALVVTAQVIAPEFAFKTAMGQRFLDDQALILRYLSIRYGVASAR